MNIPSITGKHVMAFDLDGTLAESKSPMDSEMAEIFAKILSRMKIAIISGGAYEQFERQLLALKCTDDQLRNLFFFPTTGTRCYRYTDQWDQVYVDEMTVEERQKIREAFEQVFRDIDYHHPATLYGDVIEDRGTQVSFSALGQRAPLELKNQWRDTQDVRPDIAAALQKYLPEFEVRIAGVTTIDVTRKGIDKAYGMRKMEELFACSVAEMVFVGDSLFEGGNDHAVLKTGIEAVSVANPEETKTILRQWLREMGA